MVEFGNVPAATKIAIILIGIGFIVFVVGFGAPYWTVFGILGYKGLWQECWTYHGNFMCFSTTGAHPPLPHFLFLKAILKVQMEVNNRLAEM